MRGWFQLLAVGIAIPLVVAFSTVGLLEAALPHPTADDRVGVRVLHRLETTRGYGAAIRLGGRTLSAQCRELTRNRRGIFLSDGTRLFFRGTHVVTVGPRDGRRTLVSLAAAEFPAAAADLGGSHFLYVVELAGSIVRGRDVVAGTTVVDGRPAYRIRLGRAHPLVELLVDRETLHPLVAHYRSQRLEGWSRLRNAAPRRFLAADTPVERGC